MVFSSLGRLAHEEPMSQFSYKVTRFLLKNINDPVDYKRLEKISKDLGVSIIVTYMGALYWHSEPVPRHKWTQLKERSLNKKGFYLFSLDLEPIVVFHKKDYVFFIYNFIKAPEYNSLIILLASVLIVIFIFILYLLLIKMLFSPLRELRDNAYKISRDYTADPINITKRNDEIGEITKSVNSMAIKLCSVVESKKDLIVAISHELRGPLARAKLRLNLMPSSIQKEKLDKDINEINDLIEVLLYSESLNKMTECFYTIDLNHLITDYYYKKNNPKIKLEITKEKHFIKGDPVKIKLLLSNVVNNSLKYCSKKVHIHVYSFHNSVCIKVHDDGSGVKQEDLKKLNEPFYRSDGSRNKKTGGHGLGLYICKKIVKRHKGLLKLENSLEGGLIVTISIPKIER